MLDEEVLKNGFCTATSTGGMFEADLPAEVSALCDEYSLSALEEKAACERKEIIMEKIKIAIFEASSGADLEKQKIIATAGGAKITWSRQVRKIADADRPFFRPDFVMPEVPRKPPLQGAPHPLDPALRLRRPGENLPYAQVVQNPLPLCAPLVNSLQLFLDCEFIFIIRIHAEDGGPVGINARHHAVTFYDRMISL